MDTGKVLRDPDEPAEISDEQTAAAMNAIDELTKDILMEEGCGPELSEEMVGVLANHGLRDTSSMLEIALMDFDDIFDTFGDALAHAHKEEFIRLVSYGKYIEKYTSSFNAATGLDEYDLFSFEEACFAGHCKSMPGQCIATLLTLDHDCDPSYRCP